MSKHKFKNLVKEKTTEAGFKYLLEEKAKQSKILNLQYIKLEMQEYLCEENRNKEVAKVIFKARGKSLDIKPTESGNMKTFSVLDVGRRLKLWTKS